jgi:hypothetical protein
MCLPLLPAGETLALPETGGISGIASVTSLASSDTAAIDGVVSLLRWHGSR